MTTPDGDLDFGQALFSAVRQYRHLTDDLLDVLPGGPRGYLVLMTVRAGAPKSQLALARHLGLDRTVMTYLLDTLEQAGYLTRQPDPDDRRARRLELTTVGRQALTAARERLRGAEDEMLAPLTPPERAQLAGLLQRLGRADSPAGE